MRSSQTIAFEPDVEIELWTVKTPFRLGMLRSTSSTEQCFKDKGEEKAVVP